MNEIWLLLIFFFSFCLYYVLKNKLAIFFPSSRKMLDVIIEFADLRKNDILYDLGSGDGRILVEAAERCKQVVGVEQNKFLNWIARRKIRKKGLENVKIIQGNIFEQDLSKATIIIAYLSKFVTHKLQKKIEKEVKKKTKIILIDHEFLTWRPIKMKRIGLTPIRLYMK